MRLGGFTFGAILAVIAVDTVSTDRVMAQETAITTYGLKNSAAPQELSLFSFLVGKWEGIGKTRLADGSYAEFELTWIGRYILDGMAIADEGADRFVYSIDISNDGGQSWDTGSIEMTMTRVD